MDSFEYPFATNTSPEKGVLSNWWAGCEPVCDMIRKITQDGFFFGMPWNQALGHLARKDRPLIVFVFTNEFDNAYSRVYTEHYSRNYLSGTYSIEWKYNDLEVVAFPTIKDEKTL